jgi:hypothetical protein
MPSPKRIRLRDLRKSPGLVTHEQLAAVIDAVVLIDEQTGGGGASWYDGSGAPSSGLGDNGDYYLNTANGDVYAKSAGAWAVVGNITGPAGPGVATGGTSGQILAKIDATNYNTEWIDNFTSTVKHIVKAGVALTKGQAVYVTSADCTNMIVGKADNSAEATSSKTMGLIAQNLANNGQGYVITEGLLAGLDTSAAGSAGDPVYLGTNGNLIYGLSNKPSAPNNLVFIGIVTRKQSNNGEIFVKVQNGSEINELHDVAISSIANANLLIYESTTSLWKNKTLAQTIIANLGSDGTSGQVIQTNGSGVLSWVNNGGATINQFIRTTASSTVGPGPVSTVTKLASLTIPANTFGSGSIFRIYVRAKRTNPSGSTNGSIRLVINSNDHPTTGSPTILLTASMTTVQSPGGFVRTVSVTGTTTRIAPTGFGTNSPGNDDMVANYAYSDITTIDWTVTQYFVVGATAPGTNETIELISLSVAPI